MIRFWHILIVLGCVVSSSPILSQSSDELSRRAVELAGQKKYDQALELFRKAAAKQDADSARIFHNRGWLMEMQGNITAAMENYREAVRRNPNLSDSYERMGYWNYKAGKYADAVAMGEKVIKIDPANQDVKKWIADAYRKKMEHPGAGQETKLAEEKAAPTAILPKKEEKTAAAAPAEEKKEEKEKQVKIQSSFDLTIRSGYYYEKSKLKYVKTPGALFNLPYTFDLFFKPIPDSNTRFDFTTGNPYLGAAMPSVISQYERTEAVFAFGPFGIGTGILLSHYNDDFNFGEKKFMTDAKLGVVLEYTSNESVFSLHAYPRFIPLFYDKKSATGKTYDACFAEMKYRYILDDSFSYFSRITADDFFFFDHDEKYSNYYGFYDITIGLTIGNKNAILGRDINASVEIGKKVYLMRTGVTNPYTVANGTGFFGIDRKRTGKKTVPGYHGMSNLFILSADQTITDNIFIYQKLYIEFVDRHNDHHEYTLTLGVGGKL
jgi:tetratricopeptide (TPR) repeat protein